MLTEELPADTKSMILNLYDKYDTDKNGVDLVEFIKMGKDVPDEQIQ